MSDQVPSHPLRKPRSCLDAAVSASIPMSADVMTCFTQHVIPLDHFTSNSPPLQACYHHHLTEE